MGSERNRPCHCGSGRKYKKCCINNGTPHGQLTFSETLRNGMGQPCWYHGTNAQFSAWEIPTPPKPGNDFLVRHTHVYLTSNRDFASKAGINIAVTTLSPSARILDTTADYKNSETIRQVVKGNITAANLFNVEHDFWHKGWLTGDVLRVAFDERDYDALFGPSIQWLLAAGCPPEVVEWCASQNITRGFTELICKEAEKAGFDGLYGHEIDRHSDTTKAQSQPWLAVFNKNVISAPQWQ